MRSASRIQHPLPYQSRWLVWLCAAALLASQWLVAMHGAVHSVAADAASPLVAKADARPQSASPPGWLFADHESADDCKAFDQLNHADKAAGTEPTALPLVLFPFKIALFAGLATARWHAQFEARGPPAPR